ncbi:MAG: hypothetical protein ACKO8Z_15965, partial [Prosthecobacter sp.]
MKFLRQYRQLLGWFMTCLMAVWLPFPVRGATLYWDTTGDGDSALGGTGTWNVSSLFWDPVGTDLVADNLAWPNLTIDTASFGGTA